MTVNDIKEAVKNIVNDIAPEADIAALAPDADIRRELDLDSFDFLNVLIGIHERTGVDIPESEYGNLLTLDQIVRYVDAHKGSKGSSL